MGETVSPVPAGHIVSDGDDVGTDGGNHVPGDDDTVDGNSIIVPDTAEFGGIDAGARRREDLTDDLELAGAVNPGDHVRHELGHAIGGFELDVGIGRVAHADVHIQPAVAVDEVVATAALEDVATRASQDD